MSERPPEGTRVGVVGGSSAVVDAVRGGGGDPVEGDVTAVVGSDPAAVVAVGEGALVDLVVVGVEAPVLPVSVDSSVRPVPESAVEPAVASVLAGEFDVVDYPLLAAERASRTDGPVRALFDLTLVTAEPARISEYTVSSSGELVAAFRADGVVVATAAGSTGYARAAGGPVLAPGSDVVAVVPVAPFATGADHWVLPADGIGLVVERDETPVRLVADGRDVGVVEPGHTLELSTPGTLPVAVVDASVGFFG
ncbi:MAG: ATP-NAD kinase [Haloarculaceae archaeon]